MDKFEEYKQITGIDPFDFSQFPSGPDEKITKEEDLISTKLKEGFSSAVEYMKRSFMLSDFGIPNEFKDIEHNYKQWAYFCSYFLVKSLSLLNFRNKKVTGIENLRGIQDSSAILTPNHNSHFDYLVIPGHMYGEGLKAPAIVAGDNLFVLGISWWFKSLKGFKFKRGAGLKTSQKYMKKLLNEDKEHMILFPGQNKKTEKTGRSYDGAFNPFSMLPLIFRKEADYFVPISISYSKIVEDDLFQKLSTSTSKNKFVLHDIPHVLSHFLRYGRVDYQINIGEPMVFEKNNVKKTFLNELEKNTGKLYTVFPAALVSQAIRHIENEGISGNTIPYSRLVDKISEVWDKLEKNGAIFSDSCSSYDSILKEAKYALHHGKRKAVTFERNGLVVRAKPLVDYNANTIEHLVA